MTTESLNEDSVTTILPITLPIILSTFKFIRDLEGKFTFLAKKELIVRFYAVTEIKSGERSEEKSMSYREMSRKIEFVVFNDRIAIDLKFSV